MGKKSQFGRRNWIQRAIYVELGSKASGKERDGEEVPIWKMEVDIKGDICDQAEEWGSEGGTHIVWERQRNNAGSWKRRTVRVNTSIVGSIQHNRA